jgi:D-amino-acid dehydrogenase
MLFKKDGPLFLRWSYLPQLLPFLLKFFSHANVEDVNRIADSLSAILQDAADQHMALAAGTDAEDFIELGDYIFGYASREAYEADAFGWGLRRDRGHDFEEMTAAQFAAYDPTMAGRFGYAVRCPHHGYIKDPGAYVTALAHTVHTNGGELVIAEVESLQVEDGVARGVVTSKGPIGADHVVLATGVWSGPLAEQLGVKVPLESERGYHIEFVNPSIMPKAPVMVASGKFVLTPMTGRLRCAGIVEFGGLNERRSRGPIELLKRKTLELLPELTYDRIDEWMGHRPSVADSLPVIGAFASVPNIWSAFGHQHTGLTAGPKTGRWIAQLISGQKPNTDLTPFSPARFR